MGEPSMETRIVRLEADYKYIGDKVDAIHKILTNGLSDQIKTNTAYRKSAQKFAWAILTAVIGVMSVASAGGIVWIIRSMTP